MICMIYTQDNNISVGGDWRVAAGQKSYLTGIPAGVGQFGVDEGQSPVPRVVVNVINAVRVYDGYVVLEPLGVQLVQRPGVGDALEFGGLVALDHVLALGLHHEIRGYLPGQRTPHGVNSQILTELVFSQQRICRSHPVIQKTTFI